MRSKSTFFALAALILALCGPAGAQQGTKIPRIGLLSTLSAAALLDRIEAFRQGLHELGYVEGQNLAIDYRYENAIGSSTSPLISSGLRSTSLSRLDRVEPVPQGSNFYDSHCHGE